jgi:maltooligosyltrehalose synthase
VDYQRRRQLLGELDATIDRGERDGLLETLMASCSDDRLKLYTSAVALRFRRAHQALFDHGSYTPVPAEGGRHEQLFAFVRQHEGATVLVAVPRLLATQASDAQPPLGERFWGDTRLVLPAGTTAPLQDVFTEQSTPVASQGGRQVVLARDLMHRFPVACTAGI